MFGRRTLVPIYYEYSRCLPVSAWISRAYEWVSKLYLDCSRVSKWASYMLTSSLRMIGYGERSNSQVVIVGLCNLVATFYNTNKTITCSRHGTKTSPFWLDKYATYLYESWSKSLQRHLVEQRCFLKCHPCNIPNSHHLFSVADLVPIFR